MTPPRCFIIRHGETEWSLNGRHTGISDPPLTPNGEKRMKATGKALVGNDRLIVPSRLVHIYVSPRTRAQQTLELLRLGCKERYPWQEQESAEQEEEPMRTSANIEVTEDVREWDYGEYEGKTSKEIRTQREQREEAKWDIWSQGCPGGESPQDVAARLDKLIADIREKYHRPCFEAASGDGNEQGDVLIVAHGHVLRALAMRWTAKPLEDTSLILEAGGVGTLSYEHNSIDEPAIILGGGFVVE